ncbi:hypothetical protein ACE6H2_002963 [Prunus campanulata]
MEQQSISISNQELGLSFLSKHAALSLQLQTLLEEGMLEDNLKTFSGLEVGGLWMAIASGPMKLGLVNKGSLAFVAEKENYVPCYNVSANLFVGFKVREEFDWHCEVSRNRERCLVRPPKDYKIPRRWPAGRDVIWSGNVKITKDQFLSSGSMTKRCFPVEAIYLTAFK